MKKLLVVLALVLSCNREREHSLGTITVGKPDPRFDEKWRALAARADEEADVFYIEDDRGEGLMGRVRRAARTVPRPLPPPSPSAAPTSGEPEMPPGPEVASVIRSNLAAVKACYLRITREGRMVSGRAILSFTVERNGSAGNVQVDAPAFEGTELPRCMTAEVQRWSFPRSKRGGFAVSYPFVFVGG